MTVRELVFAPTALSTNPFGDREAEELCPGRVRITGLSGWKQLEYMLVRSSMQDSGFSGRCPCALWTVRCRRRCSNGERPFGHH